MSPVCVRAHTCVYGVTWGMSRSSGLCPLTYGVTGQESSRVLVPDPTTPVWYRYWGIQDPVRGNWTPLRRWNRVSRSRLRDPPKPGTTPFPDSDHGEGVVGVGVTPGRAGQGLAPCHVFQ